QPVDSIASSNREHQGGAGGKALVTEGTGVSNASLERFRYSVGRVVITASQPDERSWESEKLRNGYFTYFLIQGLKQDNGKGPIEQLYRYLKDEVSKSVLAEKKISQSPMMLPAKPNVDIRLGVDTQPH
ncbi:MAG TPA: caspase family protein, partial [Blastocatellia bacterium]